MRVALILSILRSPRNSSMTPSFYPAAKLEPAQRMDLAIETLAKDANLSKLSCELKLFLPQLSASEGEAASRMAFETTLLQL
jgi:hypothetical protein